LNFHPAPKKSSPAFPVNKQGKRTRLVFKWAILSIRDLVFRVSMLRLGAEEVLLCLFWQKIRRQFGVQELQIQNSNLEAPNNIR
jgi:hypothetical protein